MIYINGVAQVGVGDMTKAVYDPDDDGLIAVGEMEMTSDKVAVGQGLGSSAVEEDKPTMPNFRGVTASDVLEHSNDTERIDTNAGYVLLKEIKLGCVLIGSIRVKFDMKRGVAGGGGTTNYARIYLNGAAIGTEQSSGSTTYVTKAEDFDPVVWGEDDLIQVYIKCGGTYPCHVENWRFYCDVIPDLPATNQDP